MENSIDIIRAAITDGATTEQKSAGVAACRAILAVLEPPPATPPLTAETLVAAATALRGVPVEQLLDLAIERLRRVVPQKNDPGHTTPLQFQLIPVPRKRAT